MKATEKHQEKIGKALSHWNEGSIQKAELEDAKKELISLSNVPFSRKAEDLDDIQKSRVREQDPLHEYFAKKARTESSTAKKYNGPVSFVNRFGIRPGYRWDGVDRGNGFETRLLQSISDKKALSEEGYKLAVSDL